MNHDTIPTPRTDAAWNSDVDGSELEIVSKQLEREVARLREENAALKQGKVFVDPKWICDLETQLAKAHEELCQAGLREYGN